MSALVVLCHSLLVHNTDMNAIICNIKLLGKWRVLVKCTSWSQYSCGSWLIGLLSTSNHFTTSTLICLHISLTAISLHKYLKIN